MYRGKSFPLISLHERVMMVLSSRYVDDVIIGAPYQVTNDLVKSLNI
jgi:ethanolamine-phosphate cytidylyltransferase